MKDEPWRGNPQARMLHLEQKIGNQKRELARMEGAIAASEERERRLASVAAAFVAKLDELTPAINGMFTFAHVHGNKYDGPTWEHELAALRAALTETEARP